MIGFNGSPYCSRLTRSQLLWTTQRVSIGFFHKVIPALCNVPKNGLSLRGSQSKGSSTISGVPEPLNNSDIVRGRKLHNPLKRHSGNLIRCCGEPWGGEPCRGILNRS